MQKDWLYIRNCDNLVVVVAQEARIIGLDALARLLDGERRRPVSDKRVCFAWRWGLGPGLEHRATYWLGEEA
jgi:hypothetical protein